jgi:hypothetical protein
MEVGLISQYWEQIVAFFLAVAAVVRLKQETEGLRKDLDNIVADLAKRDTYVEVVKIRAELDVAAKNITSLWNIINGMKDGGK